MCSAVHVNDHSPQNFPVYAEAPFPLPHLGFLWVDQEYAEMMVHGWMPPQPCTGTQQGWKPPDRIEVSTLRTLWDSSLRSLLSMLRRAQFFTCYSWCQKQVSWFTLTSASFSAGNKWSLRYSLRRWPLPHRHLELGGMGAHSQPAWSYSAHEDRRFLSVSQSENN